MATTQEIKIKYSDVECNLFLKPYALLNYLQDIASDDAEKLGFGYSFIHPKNLAWFLIKYRMEFIEYPKDVQNITLKTQSRGYNKLFAYRDFEFYSNEKLIARIQSVWTLVDITTRSLTQMASVFDGNDNISLFEKKEDDLVFEKIKTIQNPVTTKEFQVRFNDLDVNGHTNNGNYIIWAFETLDFDFHEKHSLKTLDMQFKKETKYNDRIISQLEIIDNKTTLHRLSNENNEDLCLIQCSWN